ncbi:MAG: acylphosphatase [Spirochaetales bacterium]|nr:acylphosphatase [Spirochaetales bacterium]
MQPEKNAITVIVSGRVQGVGFRYSTQQYAQRLGVTGFVENLIDGSVRVVAEGQSAEIDQLLAWLKKGPPGAYVRDLSIQKAAFSGMYSRFRIEY